jgi:hypothetical protein
MMSTAVYLYCVVRAARRPSPGRAPDGLARAGRPEIHPVAPALWVVTATVPLDVYGPLPLEQRLRDLDWVSQAALAHEAVVEHFAGSRTATVVPMKLFTMFSSLEKAVRDVASRREAIQQAMRRIAGAEEWGVRVFRQTPAAPPSAGQAPATGAEFLRARKQARDAVVAARTTAADAAGAAYAALRRRARAARVREARPEPGTNPPILDAAFLVPAGARTRFKAEARRQASVLARAGAALVVSGPWPAYNFVVSGEPA